MNLANFGKLWLKERDAAWAAMRGREKARLVNEVCNIAHKLQVGGILVYSDEDAHEARAFRPDIHIAAAHEVLMWVREQDGVFRCCFTAAIERRHDIEVNLVNAIWWYLLMVNQPDCIARAVVEAAIAVRGEM